MSTDTGLSPYPLQPLVQPTFRHGAVAARPPSVGGVPLQAVRLPAAAQLLSTVKARAASIAPVRRNGLLFAVTACLLAAIVPSDIAFGLEMWVSKRILGIPQHYILTTLTILLAIALDGRSLQRAFSRPAALVSLACLLMFVTVGLVRNGENGFVIRSDLYTIRWFFVGFMLMRLAIISGSLRQYLMLAAVVILVTTMRINHRNMMGAQVDTSMVRVTSSDFWPVINLGTIMFGLLVTVTWPRGIFHVVFCSAAFGLLILIGGIRTSTRSLFAVQAMCFLLCLFALSRDPRMRGRGKTLRQAGLFMLLLSACFLAYLVATGKLLGGITQLGSRFTAETSDRHNTGLFRVMEAFEMLEVMPPEAWYLGMGAGGMWYSSRINSWMSVPHIAVLGWLQKGGMIVLCVAVWTLYIRPAFAFVRATAAVRQGSPVPPPILVVGPPLLAWAALTCMSGGLDIGSFFGLGGLCALWLQLADDDRRFAAAMPTAARVRRR